MVMDEFKLYLFGDKNRRVHYLDLEMIFFCWSHLCPVMVVAMVVCGVVPDNDNDNNNGPYMVPNNDNGNDDH